MRRYRSAERGVSIAQLFGFLVPLALLWGGGQGLYVYLTNFTPTAMRLNGFEPGATEATWLKLDGCMVFMPDAVVMEDKPGGEITKLYLPLRPVETPDAPLAKVVLATNDARLIALFQELDRVKPADVPAFVNEHRARFQFPIDIAGLVHCGLAGQDDRGRGEVVRVGRDLSPDFVVIEDGQEPSLFVSLLIFLPGVALLAAACRAWRPRPEEPASAPKMDAMGSGAEQARA